MSEQTAQATFEAQRKAFFQAQRAMYDAAERCLQHLVVRIYPNATTVTLEGTNDSGELSLSIESVSGPDWKADYESEEHEERFTELTDAANEYLCYMSTAGDYDSLLGESFVDIPTDLEAPA